MSKRRVKLGIPSAELHGGLHMCHIREKAHTRLRAAFVEIIHSLCIPMPGFVHEHEKQLFPVSYCLTSVGAFEPDVPDKLRELWGAIDEAITDAVIGGEKTGSSLLMGLAQGTVTIHDFNDATIGEKDA